MTLELTPLAHRFLAGARVRLQVSGGSHPRFVRNLGTNERGEGATRTVPSHRTIQHAPAATSRLHLPIAVVGSVR